MTKAKITVRPAESELDLVMAMRAYKEMHDGGTVPGSFSARKTFSSLISFIQGPGSVVLLALDEAGELLGLITLAQQSFWFSEDGRCLIDKGLYVRPGEASDGACKALLEAAANLADDMKLDLFITVFNSKRKRGAKSQWARAGETIGYTNRGAVLAHLQER